MAGRVISLQVCEQRHGPMSFRDEVKAVARGGLEGDIHADRDTRSVLLMDTESLSALGLSPGDLREQVTVELPGLQTLESGARLRLGDVEIEVSKPCDPCTHIGEHLGAEDLEAMRRRLVGRRGILARVVGGGLVRVGDPVEVR
jgi:MOSC domain-containing protein YiiM